MSTFGFMIDPEVSGVVRGLGRSRAIFAALLPSLNQQARAVRAALDAMDVLFPRQQSTGADDLPEVEAVSEWVIIGRDADGRDLASVSIPCAAGRVDSALPNPQVDLMPNDIRNGIDLVPPGTSGDLLGVSPALEASDGQAR